MEDWIDLEKVGGHSEDSWVVAHLHPHAELVPFPSMQNLRGAIWRLGDGAEVGFRISGYGFGISSSGFRAPVSRFQVSGLEFRVSGFGFEVWSFGFRVSGLRFQVSLDRHTTRKGDGSGATFGGIWMLASADVRYSAGTISGPAVWIHAKDSAAWKHLTEMP